MSDFVWVEGSHDRDGWAQEAIDLHLCKRFLLMDPEIQPWYDQFWAFYLAPDGRWIERKIGELIAEPLQASDFKDGTYEEKIKHTVHRERCCYLTHEASIIKCASDIMLYFGCLPQELEQYRDLIPYIDEPPNPPGILEGEFHRRVDDYLREKGGNVDIFPRKPIWNRNDRTLFYGDYACRVFKKEAKNQFLLLDEFESQGWPDSIQNPFGSDEQQLHQTIKDFNLKLKPGSGIRLRQDNLRAAWIAVKSRERPSSRRLP